MPNVKEYINKILHPQLCYNQMLLHTISKWAIFISRATDYGLMKIDNLGQVVQFAEKPRGADLEAMVSS